jgi:hypothetical protein
MWPRTHSFMGPPGRLIGSIIIYIYIYGGISDAPAAKCVKKRLQHGGYNIQGWMCWGGYLRNLSGPVGGELGCVFLAWVSMSFS